MGIIASLHSYKALANSMYLRVLMPQLDLAETTESAIFMAPALRGPKGKV